MSGWPGFVHRAQRYAAEDKYSRDDRQPQQSWMALRPRPIIGAPGIGSIRLFGT